MWSVEILGQGGAALPQHLSKTSKLWPTSTAYILPGLNICPTPICVTVKKWVQFSRSKSFWHATRTGTHLLYINCLYLILLRLQHALANYSLHFLLFYLLALLVDYYTTVHRCSSCFVWLRSLGYLHVLTLEEMNNPKNYKVERMRSRLWS